MEIRAGEGYRSENVDIETVRGCSYRLICVALDPYRSCCAVKVSGNDDVGAVEPAHVGVKHLAPEADCVRCPADARRGIIWQAELCEELIDPGPFTGNNKPPTGD